MRRVEQRVTGEFLMVQGPAGIVVSIAGWILDRVICAEMTIGTRRVDLAALIELRRLLMGVSNPTHSRIDVGIVREEGNAVSQVAGSGAGSADEPPVDAIPSYDQPREQAAPIDLVDVARQRGFSDVEIIDDDLGRSASGTVAHPGFDRLVAWLCAGKVGAVLCFDASRLARNGRDWHHLLELCGLVEARVIDLDGVYDPCRPNDRLLPGMKGSISEFELGVLRTRMLDAARSKASRGELRISVPFGYIWHREAGLGLDVDLGLQEVIRLIFARFRELGRARQVLLSMKADQIHFPRPSDEGRMTSFDWLPIRYRNVIAILKNPFYAGVYVYGKSEKRASIVEGRARRSYGHGKPIGTWELMIKDHHEGYIGSEEYERNQKQLALNNYGRTGGVKSGRGGKALLSGIMTCGRCGRRLSVAYTGNPHSRPVYRCDKPNLMMGLPRCMTFGGPRVDAAVGRELLVAVEPMAIWGAARIIETPG